MRMLSGTIIGIHVGTILSYYTHWKSRSECNGWFVYSQLYSLNSNMVGQNSGTTRHMFLLRTHNMLLAQSSRSWGMNLQHSDYLVSHTFHNHISGVQCDGFWDTVGIWWFKECCGGIWWARCSTWSLSKVFITSCILVRCLCIQDSAPIFVRIKVYSFCRV